MTTEAVIIQYLEESWGKSDLTPEDKLVQKLKAEIITKYGDNPTENEINEGMYEIIDRTFTKAENDFDSVPQVPKKDPDQWIRDMVAGALLNSKIKRKERKSFLIKLISSIILAAIAYLVWHFIIQVRM